MSTRSRPTGPTGARLTGPTGTRSSTGRWRTFVPGQRVVVRRRRDDHPAPEEPPLTDVLGEVIEVTDEGLRVAGQHGDTWIPASDVVAARPVPPPPR